MTINAKSRITITANEERYLTSFIADDDAKHVFDFVVEREWQVLATDGKLSRFTWGTFQPVSRFGVFPCFWLFSAVKVRSWCLVG